MVRKVDIAVAFIFGILIAVPLSLQFVGAWTGTQNTLSDGYVEVASVNATNYYFGANDENLTAWVETLDALGLLQDGSEGLTGNWDVGSYNITADNFTAQIRIQKTTVGIHILNQHSVFMIGYGMIPIHLVDIDVVTKPEDSLFFIGRGSKF